MRPQRPRGLGLLSARADDDPLSGVANLFDLGIVFALGFLVALLTTFRLGAMFDPESKVTVTVERKDGLTVVLRKDGETIVRRTTMAQAEGDGEAVGTAYRLADGTIVYVPEDGR